MAPPEFKPGYAVSAEGREELIKHITKFMVDKKLDDINFTYLNNDQLLIFWKGLLNNPRVMRVSGIAGAGKSELIKLWIQVFTRCGRPPVIIAPTAVAAIAVGGSTVDSFFGGYSYVIENLNRVSTASKEKWSTVKYMASFNKMSKLPKHESPVIVDEADMCSGSHFLTILCRFNGKIIFVGDHNQLLPVRNYKSITLNLLTDVYKFEIPMYTLNVVERTSSLFLREFCQFLKHCVENKCDLNCLSIHDRLRLKEWSIIQSNEAFMEQPDPKVYVCFTNKENDINNRYELNRLTTETMVFPIRCENVELYEKLTKQATFHPDRFMTILTLKIGCTVMFTRNTALFKNGMTGIFQEFDDKLLVLKVRMANGQIVVVDLIPYRLQYKYQSVTVFQYPIMLAYSLTVHKMQGQTCNYPIMLKSNPRFNMRFLYVFVSRVTALNLLFFAAPLSTMSYKGFFKNKGGEHIDCNYSLANIGELAAAHV